MNRRRGTRDDRDRGRLRVLLATIILNTYYIKQRRRYTRCRLTNVFFVFFLFFFFCPQFVLRASTNSASGTTSVSRVRRTAKRPTKECPSAGATPDITDHPKTRNRCRARVSITVDDGLVELAAFNIRVAMVFVFRDSKAVLVVVLPV